MIWHPGAGAPLAAPFFNFDSPAAWLFNMSKRAAHRAS